MSVSFPTLPLVQLKLRNQRRNMIGVLMFLGLVLHPLAATAQETETEHLQLRAIVNVDNGPVQKVQQSQQLDDQADGSFWKFNDRGIKVNQQIQLIRQHVKRLHESGQSQKNASGLSTIQINSAKNLLQDFSKKDIQIHRVETGDQKFSAQWHSGNATSGNHSASGNIVLQVRKADPSNQGQIMVAFSEDSWIEAETGVVQLTDQIYQKFESDKEDRFWIGVKCVAREALRPKTGNKQQEWKGLFVEKVVEGGAAEKAGVRERDLLMQWDLAALHTTADLVSNIQKSADQAARLSLFRPSENKTIEVAIRPQLRARPSTETYTFFAPSTEFDVARKRIGELEEHIVSARENADHNVRLVIVGRGLNFGKKDVKLQWRPDRMDMPPIKQMIDRVANQKATVIVEKQGFQFKELGMDSEKVEFSNLVVNEIWNSFDIKVEGRDVAFSKLSPQVLRSRSIHVQSKPRNLPVENSAFVSGPNGLIVFSNPHFQFSNYREQVFKLKRQANEMKRENERLKLELEKVRASLSEIQHKMSPKE